MILRPSGKTTLILEATEELPVRVRLAGADRAAVRDVASLDLFSTTSDGPVPLTALGRLALEPTVAVIDREHGARTNRIFGFVTAGVLPGAVLETYQARLDHSEFTLPDGYTIVWGGEAGERNRAVGNLMGSVAVLTVLMAAALILSFRSFRLAGVIAVVAGASAGLGLGALWLFDMPFGFMAIVGIMGLIGVAINDSIVVLAALKENAAARAGDLRAVRDVVVRATRHVLATTVTTIAGFTPLLIAGGGFWPPLVLVIAGGVVGATLLALLMVPCAFVLLMTPRAARSRAASHEAIELALA